MFDWEVRETNVPVTMSTNKHSAFDGLSRDPINREARSIFGKPESDNKGTPMSELSREDLVISKQPRLKPPRRPKGQTLRTAADKELRVGAVFGHVRVPRQREDHYFLWECECDCGRPLIIAQTRFQNGQVLCNHCKDKGRGNPQV